MSKLRYDAELFAQPEAVADGKHVIATYLDGVSLQDAAKTRPELRSALDAWGVWGEESTQLFALR